MKRIAYFVVGIHLALLLWMMLWSPVKPIEKKPLQVKTTIVVQSKPQPIQPVTPVAKVSAKPKAKTPVKKTPAPAPLPKPRIDPKLMDELRTSLAKIENRVTDHFVDDLVSYLQSTLILPEVGDVKVELTLKQNGALVGVQFLEIKSERNRKFLESALKTLHYPPFSGILKDEKEHAFVITFSNY